MNAKEIIRRIDGFLNGRYDVREYPSLNAQRLRFAETLPFASRRILDCTPVFANTLVKYLALLSGGAELTIGICDTVPHDPTVVKMLANAGVPLLRAPSDATHPFDVILDCDGSRSDLAPSIGVCELTRSGFYRYRESHKPVILVDSSRIKEIETSIGTGDGFMRGMEKFGFSDWNGRKVAIFGFGKVGRGVAYRCLREGAAVTVIDRTDPPLPHDRLPNVTVTDCRDRDAVRRSVADCDFLVTATGVRGAMKAYDLGPAIASSNRPVVAAIGIEDEWLDGLAKQRIVNHGVAVNFALEEPTLLRYIDPTMALSNQSALDLVAGTVTSPGINPPCETSEALCLDPVLACGLITGEIRDFGL